MKSRPSAGASIRAAVADARSRAGAAGIVSEYLERSLSKAEDAAEGYMLDAAE